MPGRSYSHLATSREKVRGGDASCPRLASRRTRCEVDSRHVFYAIAHWYRTSHFIPYINRRSHTAGGGWVSRLGRGDGDRKAGEEKCRECRTCGQRPRSPWTSTRWTEGTRIQALHDGSRSISKQPGYYREKYDRGRKRTTRTCLSRPSTPPNHPFSHESNSTAQDILLRSPVLYYPVARRPFPTTLKCLPIRSACDQANGTIYA